MKKIILLILLLLASPLEAANHYIRAAAAGTATGADWTNAWTTITGRTWVRGDTYYIAKGTYTAGVTFSTAPSSTTLITLLGATVADHGTTTGWSDTFSVEVTEALFNGGLDWTTAYWRFDGQVGGAQSNGTTCITLTCWKTGHGFHVHETASGSPVLMGEGACGNITVSHTNIEGNHGDGAAGGPGNDGLQVFQCSGSDKTFNVTYSYLHDTGRCIFYVNGTPNHIIADHVVTGLNESDPGEHSEMTVIHSTSDLIYRYSIFLAVDPDGTGAFIGGDDCNHCHYEVYGNVFYNATGTDWGTGNNGFFATDSTGTTDGCLIYNNTFINTHATMFGSSGGHVNNIIKNNYWYLVTTDHDASGFGTQSFDHFQDTASPAGSNTTSGSGNPFTAYITGDFSLTTGTTAGATIASPYATDMFAAARGADGTWDRGAVEFNSSGSSSTLPMSRIRH